MKIYKSYTQVLGIGDSLVYGFIGDSGQMLHRKYNRPAVINNTSRSYAHMGKFHRTNGPSYIMLYGNNTSFTTWSIHGVICTSFKEYATKAKLSDTDKLKLLLKYGHNTIM